MVTTSMYSTPRLTFFDIYSYQKNKVLQVYAAHFFAFQHALLEEYSVD
ncbi:MAG: Unknown protein [uncultured Aureispira sp.]|uniref:Uncharacterized protein n=1 Tax=uncultured Aureispira sp. TaxID=1331704 RepID=A0A6S6U2U2_9BACT|nr:MAG: Unknown protein [uncultured Aureispira sp.]